MDVLLFENDVLDVGLVLRATEELAEPIQFENSEEKSAKIKNENYFESTVPNYTDEQFKSNFRMSRNTFEKFCRLVSTHMTKTAVPKISLPKKVLLTIYILSYEISYNNAGDKFGLSSSTAYYIFKEIVEVICSPAMINEFNKWPEEEQYEEIAKDFYNRSNGFPGVIGIIDGCHISIKHPVGNAQDFYNRHESHSIILQAVCDQHLKFTDIFVGLPGRMHDARVFRNSPLYKRLINNFLPGNYYILGDSPYPLFTSVMTPYKDNGHLSDVQQNYNVKLSSIRSTIERAFGLLKSKFRKLRYLDIAESETGNNIIAAACILHNFLIECGEIGECLTNYPLRNGMLLMDIQDPQVKRNYITELLY